LASRVRIGGAFILIRRKARRPPLNDAVQKKGTYMQLASRALTAILLMLVSRAGAAARGVAEQAG
jgi:hypothetical protein